MTFRCLLKNHKMLPSYHPFFSLVSQSYKSLRIILFFLDFYQKIVKRVVSPSTKHPQQPLFVFCYNKLQHLFFFTYLYFWPQLPTPSPYNLTGWRETHKDIRRTYQCSTSSREFEECLNKAGGLFLKETQPEWKPETCTGKRDPFTFIW